MKSKQKRSLFLSLVLTVLFVIGAIPAFAAEDAIPSIQIDTVLQSDGSAVVTEVWDVRGVSDGTEYYKALNNMDGMRVHSLVVRDESGTQYEALENWDTDRSREEKAGKSGILQTSKGYELCWGIGTYGDHQYTIQYVIDGLVKNYGDYAGFYHQFLSDMSSAPESVSVTIRVQDSILTANNARIWGYGYPGTVDIDNSGVLTAVSSDSLGGDDYVNLLCRFDKGLFPGASTANLSFEELQKKAEDESSNTALYIILALLGVGTAGAIGLGVFYYGRYKLSDGSVVRLPQKKQIETTWSIPFGGNIPAVYAAMKLLRRGIACEQLMGAYLIRWQEMHYINIEEREKPRKNKKPKKEEAIVFHPEKAPSGGAELALYHILMEGVDANGILWSSGIEKYADKLYDKLTHWAEVVQKEGEAELIRSGAAAKGEKEVVRFTAAGFDRAVQMLGFQNYLAEMRSSQKDELATRKLWGDYLVFAALFDMGEQVLKSMQALDPAYFDTFSGRYGYSPYQMIYFMSITNNLSSAATPDTSGTGGVAGSVGGGGFSGGGGGGSR